MKKAGSVSASAAYCYSTTTTTTTSTTTTTTITATTPTPISTKPTPYGGGGGGVGYVLITEFLIYCTSILSHPLYLSYFLFFSPYLIKLVTFLSPLFLTTALLLLPGYLHFQSLPPPPKNRLVSEEEVELLEKLGVYEIVFGDDDGGEDFGGGCDDDEEGNGDYEEEFHEFEEEGDCGGGGGVDESTSSAFSKLMKIDDGQKEKEEEEESGGRGVVLMGDCEVGGGGDLESKNQAVVDGVESMSLESDCLRRENPTAIVVSTTHDDKSRQPAAVVSVSSDDEFSRKFTGLKLLWESREKEQSEKNLTSDNRKIGGEFHPTTEPLLLLPHHTKSNKAENNNHASTIKDKVDYKTTSSPQPITPVPNTDDNNNHHPKSSSERLNSRTKSRRLGQVTPCTPPSTFNKKDQTTPTLVSGTTTTTFGGSRRKEVLVRKEIEWRRTLECKLFEERHNNNNHNFGNTNNNHHRDEGMDVLWETYDDKTEEITKTNVDNKGRSGASGELRKLAVTKTRSSSKLREVNTYDEDEEVRSEIDDSGQQVCCLQALRMSAGKMSFVGMGKKAVPVVGFTKVFKGWKKGVVAGWSSSSSMLLSQRRRNGGGNKKEKD